MSCVSISWSPRRSVYDGGMDRYSKTFAALQGQRRSVRLLNCIRPNILATPFYKLMLPSQRRGIVSVDGIRLYLDPASHLGHTVLTAGCYEPDTVAVLRQHIKPGNVVLDIGANEGVMSAYAASLVGRTGCVVAVEPQSRLLDVLEINLALNSTGSYQVVHGAVSDHDGPVTVSLSAEGNTGASSIVHKYRWSRKTESVPAYTIEKLAKACNLTSIDFVKIDVEGYEPEVLKSLLGSSRKIGKVLVDYHTAILENRGINPETPHNNMLKAGYNTLLGSLSGGYVLYALA
jgi:FkbM family methyltransferase